MRKGNVALTLVAILAIGAIAVSGFTWFKLQNQPQPSPAASAGTATSTPTPTASPSPAAQTVVVWEPSGSFSPNDKAQLQARVINPFVDYYKEADQGKLLTLTISVNTQASAITYPFLGQGVLENGGTIGFVIEKPGGQIKWWVPECMGQCPLSAEFKAKYPEIMTILGY